ncbi:MAG TPA: DNA polymerase Y family protein [Pseudolysinimonas sp.]|nr:DNA polymerase Y family protein [Pseudolysinimonas sp.]
MFDTGGALSSRLMVLWVPDWPVVAHAFSHKIAAATPFALVEKGQIFACSTAAREAGVQKGLRQREAQARCPGLQLMRYDPALDARVFEPVLTVLEQSVPGWHPIRPGMVATRSRGPARYYGGEKAAALTVLGLVRDQLAQHQGILAEREASTARVGVADGLFAAERAARWVTTESVTIVPQGAAAAFLAPLPVALLEQPELTGLLPRLGIRTLGDFAALRADDVAARFGPGGVRLHALAGGRDSRPATPRIPPRDCDVERHFEPPLDRVDQVAFAVRTASDELVNGLLAQHLVCTALRVELWGENGELSERVWLHPRSFSPPELVDRVRWQLDGARETGASSTVNSAVLRVRLSPDSVDPVSAHERGLWGTGPDDGVHSGLSRLQGMVGHRGVMTATLSGGRGLADRQSFVPWGERQQLARMRSQPWPGALPSPAPATVYALPRAVSVHDAHGRLVQIDARGQLSGSPVAMVSNTGAPRRLTAWAGPWPIDERWWDPAAARAVSRFQVVDAEGMGWLLVLDAEGWWVEGRYD